MNKEKNIRTIRYLQDFVSDKRQRSQLLQNADEALNRMAVPIRQPQLVPANAADLNIRP